MLAGQYDSLYGFMKVTTIMGSQNDLCVCFSSSFFCHPLFNTKFEDATLMARYEQLTSRSQEQSGKLGALLEFLRLGIACCSRSFAPSWHWVLPGFGWGLTSIFGWLVGWLAA